MRGKLPGLDGLRALAALAVFVDHAEQTQEWVGLDHFDGNQMTSLGRQGVEVFFVLSGFLITRLLLRERDHSGAVSLPRFYARRTLRIWPLYSLVVFVIWIVLPWAVHFAPPEVRALSEIHTRTMGAPGDPRLSLYLLFLANFSFWLYPHVFYVLAFALAAGGAALSYRYFEEPLLRLRERAFFAPKA